MRNLCLGYLYSCSMTLPRCYPGSQQKINIQLQRALLLPSVSSLRPPSGEMSSSLTGEVSCSSSHEPASTPEGGESLWGP